MRPAGLSKICCKDSTAASSRSHFKSILDTIIFKHYASLRMLVVKLKKVGRKNQRTFRLIVQEDREKLDGKNTEDLGWFNPHVNQFKINKTRADYWISNGAKPTDSAAKLLERVKNSEAGGYEGREGRKKNKKAKGGGEAAALGVASTEAVVEAVGDEVAESAPAESAPAEEAVPESAPEEAQVKEEEVKEESAEEAPAEEVEEVKEGE